MLFGSAARPSGAPPNDLDIAVVTDDGGALLQLLDGLSDLLPEAVLDMVDLRTASIVLRSEALAGIPLFERVPELKALQFAIAMEPTDGAVHLFCQTW